MEDIKKIGIRISFNIKKKKKMKEKEMKQYELAKKLNRTPENMSYFFKCLENGGASNIKTLAKIASALNVDISIFFA